MGFFMSRFLPAAFLLRPSRRGCGVAVALVIDAFGGPVTRGIAVGVTSSKWKR